MTLVVPPMMASFSTTIPFGAITVNASSESIGPFEKIPPEVSMDKSVISSISILPPVVMEPPRSMFPSTTTSLATPRPPFVVTLALELLVAVVLSTTKTGPPMIAFFSTARPPLVCTEACVVLVAGLVDATAKSESTRPPGNLNIPRISTSSPKMALFFTLIPPLTSSAARLSEVASVKSVRCTGPSIVTSLFTASAVWIWVSSIPCRVCKLISSVP